MYRCADLRDKRTRPYLYGNLYIADGFMREREYPCPLIQRVYPNKIHPLA